MAVARGRYIIHPLGESVADACRRRVYNNTATRSCPPRCRACLTMSADSPNDSFSIFNNGKLKPGVYKIQNLYSQTYVDIHEHSRDLCCRPATTLGEGRGLVRPFQYSVLRVSNNQKWEIKPLGAGYSVRRVGIQTTRSTETMAVYLTTRDSG